MTEPATFTQSIDVDGYALVHHVLSATDCKKMRETVAALGIERAGVRNLLGYPWCAELAGQLRRHPGIAGMLPEEAVAVQCTYFEKSAQRNWLVPMHQDLSIPVLERIDHPALSGWSEKEGTVFVQAPPSVLQEVLALRLHLEDCGVDDGALRVVPGSHRAGRLDDSAQLHIREQRKEVVCTAQEGDVLAMRPLLLHASSKANGSGKRRVLHFVFGPPALPFGLSWSAARLIDGRPAR